MHDRAPTPARRRVGRILYWLTVLAVSLALAIGLLLLLQSCDASSVGAGAVAHG